ncbi:hypothetical protein VB712_15315 [Spirulina sp. CCNP1310]|uniref:hypothetical protein n=1 Tax=Spirulina sp. CCNP1310 TaxID=3110249 RepID=UPI002B207801|nr:hypothetical protein [Spirulina sp. CCNP1310]MEA5420601.1 hypothetical protein [Spirulina sp. CCNP1310]
MHYSFKTLTITTQEVEDLTNFDLLTHLKLDFYQALILSNPKARQRLLSTELSLFFVSFIVLTPIFLILSRSWSAITNDGQGLAILFLSLLIVLLGCFGGLNLFLKQTCLSMKTVSQILLEIDKYNRVIYSLNLLQELQSSENHAAEDVNPMGQGTEAMTFDLLKTIKKSLIRAITVEQMLRTKLDQNIDLQSISQQLEQDLERLMSHENSYGLVENHQLLADTLKISMMVHQEVQNLSRYPL